MENLLLVVIADSVVKNIYRCETSEQLELAFKAVCDECSVVPTDADYENGYIETHDGSICMTSSEDWMDVVQSRGVAIKVEQVVS